MRFTIISLVICLLAFQVKAQQKHSAAAEKEKTTLTLAALYGSNVSYYGQSTAEKLPYFLTNATLMTPIGLNLSASAYQLINYGSGISATDLSIGYDHAFNTNLTAGLSYTRSLFPENSPLLQAANENNINATVAYQWPWFKSSLASDFAFGMQSDAFIGFSNSKMIELGNLFDENDQMAIEPAIELVAGTQHFLETYTQKKNKGKGKGSENGNQMITLERAATSFNLLSYNFKLPFTYSRSQYMAELSYQFSILGDKAIRETKKTQSFFNLGFYYQF